MKFWLGDPGPKFWGRGPLMLGALVRDGRVALNAERMAALSVAVTEKIAIEKISFYAL